MHDNVGAAQAERQGSVNVARARNLKVETGVDQSVSVVSQVSKSRPGAPVIVLQDEFHSPQAWRGGTKAMNVAWITEGVVVSQVSKSRPGAPFLSGAVVKAEEQRGLGAGLGFGDEFAGVLVADGRELVGELHVLF